MAERDYERFTGPARLERDMHVLEGFLQGISVDGQIKPPEAAALLRWCADHDRVAGQSPFNELLPKIRFALQDGNFDQEEREDLLWFCRRVQTPNDYYAVITSDMQRLHGLLLGIAADGQITEEELRGVREWLDKVEHLKGTWPFDEIDAQVTSIMADGKIDTNEHRMLMNFCSEFAEAAPRLVLKAPFDEEPIRVGVCASCPEIVFPDRRFCFTGSSPVAERRKLQEVVRDLGGVPVPRVVKDLDYLVVGAEGNNSWAFSCYGRKVEAAMNLRKEGARVTIAHENDFWDAAAEKGIERPMP